MKKTYAAPTLIISGNVVNETLIGSKGGDENGFVKPLREGSVGFYL